MSLADNKNNAIAFYKMAYEGNPKSAVEQYLGEEYIQHNPDVADGTQGFIDYFDKMHKDYPDKSIEFVRCIAEGNLVALHTHQTWPGNDQYITMDFFRFDDNGKICEHWARLQGFPDEFNIPVSDAQAYKQFGNSVAVPAIQATAQKILEKLECLKS